MRKFGHDIKLAPRVQRPLPEKEILWVSQDGGCKHFPKNYVMTERKYSIDPVPLLAFGRAMSQALDRVWIVDEYLLMPDRRKADSDKELRKKISNRIETLLEWLHVEIVASDIRLLTKTHKEIEKDDLARFKEREDEINSYTERRAQQCAIKVRTHLTEKFDFIHDRFAIIDDELWHFGGTVGGFHASVSAASRGWCASDHGAIDFFNMAWEAGDKK